MVKQRAPVACAILAACALPVVAPAAEDHSAHGNHTMHEDPAAPQGHPVHYPVRAFLMADRLEWRSGDGDDALGWELTSWIGRDFDRLWLRAEGERAGGVTHESRVEALWGHAFARWWDVVAGVRHDFAPGDSRTWAALGLVGTAPLRFEVELTAWVGEGGATALGLAAEYDFLVTQRLVLQPRLAMNAFGSTDAARGEGSGLSEVAAGLRLRYELRRQFAPYAGVEYVRLFGGTADLARATGGRTGEWEWLVGVRAWL